MEVGRHQTAQEAAICALEEYIRRHRQLEILELSGKIAYYPDYDYKALRRREARTSQTRRRRPDES
jgi:hypothetical protein